MSRRNAIIPYQEQIGNYNKYERTARAASIIPYQEQIGNYNDSRCDPATAGIIPYQEQIGNYNIKAANVSMEYYTIPRLNRE